MKIHYDIVSNFSKHEYDTNTKILLNICNPLEYGVTDTNIFYSRFYNKIEKEFKNHTHLNKFGYIKFCPIFTYHIICNMFCVDWPKTTYNIIPFKIKYFKSCCLKLNNHLIDNDIKCILSPIFGTEILQGNWKDILSTMNDIFDDNITYVIFRNK